MRTNQYILTFFVYNLLASELSPSHNEFAPTSVVRTPNIHPKYPSTSMKLSRFFTALGVSLCALGSLHTASAALLAGDTLYIDFGPSTKVNGSGQPDGFIMPSTATINAAAGNSTGVADGYGIYWNNAILNTANGGGNVPGSVANLINSTNVGTGVGLNFSGGWQANGFNNGGLMAPSSALLGNIASQNATGDYFFVLDNSASMTFTGLNPALTYNFQMFATRQETAVRTSVYSITDINGLHTYTLQTSGPGIGASGYNGNNDEFATFTGIVPDGSGNITLTLVGGTAASKYGYIGTLQMTAVPEPGTLTLLGAAGLTLLVIRRRRA